MLLQNTLFVTFSFLTLCAASPTPEPAHDESFLPRERYSRDVVNEMRQEQTYPPGHIYYYADFPIDPSNTTSNETYQVPVVQGDPDILLEGEDGDKARAIAARAGHSCIIWGRVSGSCSITYCWASTGGSFYTAHVTMVGATRSGGAPTNMYSSNTAILNKWDSLNTWFKPNHGCSHGDTHLVAIHKRGNNAQLGLLYPGRDDSSVLDHVQCDNCIFTGLKCDGELLNNLLAFTNGFSHGVTCTANDHDEL